MLLPTALCMCSNKMKHLDCGLLILNCYMRVIWYIISLLHDATTRHWMQTRLHLFVQKRVMVWHPVGVYLMAYAISSTFMYTRRWHVASYVTACTLSA